MSIGDGQASPSPVVEIPEPRGALNSAVKLTRGRQFLLALVSGFPPLLSPTTNCSTSLLTITKVNISHAKGIRSKRKETPRDKRQN